MDELSRQIESATLEMTSDFDWHSILIDMEVEQHGKEPKTYLIDSSVAVCFCRQADQWTDYDLDLSKTYRQLFHALFEASDPQWVSCRLIFRKDRAPEWHFDASPARRLNHETTPDVDKLIDQLLAEARQRQPEE